MSKKAAIIIPARYGSTRFPGKPLAMLTGKHGTPWTLIEWTIAAARKAVLHLGEDIPIIVATDDSRISDYLASQNRMDTLGCSGVVMTSPMCRNGTERCAHAMSVFDEDHDLIFNWQGDAPLIQPQVFATLHQRMRTQQELKVATPAVTVRRDQIKLGSVTVVTDNYDNALYFSRAVLPEKHHGVSAPTVRQHIGMYAYRRKALEEYAGTPLETLERTEQLEQLRWLESDSGPIKVVEVVANEASFCEVNFPEDIPVVERYL